MKVDIITRKPCTCNDNPCCKSAGVGFDLKNFYHTRSMFFKKTAIRNTSQIFGENKKQKLVILKNIRNIHFSCKDFFNKAKFEETCMSFFFL